MIKVVAGTGRVWVLSPLPFLLCDQRPKTFAAVTNIDFLLRRTALHINLILRFKDLTRLILFVKALRLSSKSLFLRLLVDDGLVIGRNGADGELTEGIFDASLMNFTS